MFLTGKLFCQTSVGKRWCILAWGFVRKLGLPTAVQKSQRFPVVSIQQALKLSLDISQNSPGAKVQFTLCSLPLHLPILTFLLRAAPIFTRVRIQYLFLEADRRKQRNGAGGQEVWAGTLPHVWLRARHSQRLSECRPLPTRRQSRLLT